MLPRATVLETDDSASTEVNGIVDLFKESKDIASKIITGRAEASLLVVLCT